jgi:hypothetical protein
MNLDIKFLLFAILHARSEVDVMNTIYEYKELYLFMKNSSLILMFN